MNQNQNGKKPWYKQTAFLMAMAVGVLVGGYFLVTLVLLSPKNSKMNLYEMTLTEKDQQTIFTNQKITEVKFDWVATSSSDGKDLTLTAVGGYQVGDKMVYDEATRVTLTKGNRVCAGLTSPLNYNSSIYLTRGDIKALHDLPTGTPDPVAAGDLTVPVKMTPFCTSDAGRKNNLYFEASTATNSRTANPMPPFTSPCASRCED